jgi:lysozyme
MQFFRDLWDALKSFFTPMNFQALHEPLPAKSNIFANTPQPKMDIPTPVIDPNVVPQSVLDLLKEREGWKTVVYSDTKNFWTVGMGHKLLPTELEQYPPNSTVPDAQLIAWQQEDTLNAYHAAIAQASQIGEPRLVNALTSVNFQLGLSWAEKFPSTWHLLVTRQWNEAAKHIEASLWARETPKRTADFVAALDALQVSAPLT